MNPKNIEQYVVKSVIAYMDLEKNLKEKVERLEEEVEYYKKLFYEASYLGQISFYKCNYKECNSYSMDGPRYDEAFNCKYVTECTTCFKDYCDLHLHEIGDEFVCKNCTTQVNE